MFKMQLLKFNVIGELLTRCTFYRTAIQTFDIATCLSLSVSILLRYFDMNIATAEKPTSHKYDFANGTRKASLSLQSIIEKSDLALTQNELGLYKFFKVRFCERSASINVNPCWAFALSAMFAHSVVLHVLRKISLKMRDFSILM